jgi:hypothetical protein
MTHSIRKKLALTSPTSGGLKPQSFFNTKGDKIRIYKTIILSVVLKGNKTWSLILREENILRVPENRVLRIFGLKKDEMIGGRITLRNDERHNCPPSQGG